MRAYAQLLLAILCVGVVFVGPLSYAMQRNTHFRNFHVVEEGVLYRSGQLSPEMLEQVVRERKIHTLITLRTSRVQGVYPPDTWEEEFCNKWGMKHFRIVPRVWGADEQGDIPAEEAIQQFLSVMDDARNYPVLVHCFAGIHRTGTMCAIYRMEFDRWPSDRAINEAQLIGYDPRIMRKDIEPYLRGYSPRWQHGKK